MSTLPITVILIGEKARIDKKLLEKFKQQNFILEFYETAEMFLFDGQNRENCIYFVFCCPVNIGRNDLIRIIRMRDKVSVIYSVAVDFEEEELQEALLAGADFSVRAPILVERCMVELRNHFNKVEYLSRAKMAGGVELIPEASTVIRNGQVRKLTTLEFRIFNCLFEDLGKVFSREEITSMLDMDTTLRTIDAHISSLRKKIDPLNFNIETRRGKGYQLSIQ